MLWFFITFRLTLIFPQFDSSIFLVHIFIPCTLCIYEIVATLSFELGETCMVWRGSAQLTW